MFVEATNKKNRLIFKGSKIKVPFHLNKLGVTTFSFSTKYQNIFIASEVQGMNFNSGKLKHLLRTFMAVT